MISPDWTTTDHNFADFFYQLRTVGASADFVDHCRKREAKGRAKHGHRFVAVDNPREAQDQAADVAIYAWLTTLRERREGRREQTEIALTIARHAAIAWQELEALARLEEKDGNRL
jgi:hypothetical protein